MSTKLPDDVEAYFEAVPGDRRPRLLAIHGRIIERFPDAAVSMAYRMPTYKTSTGGWCSIANQKGHIALYTCGEQHLAAFKMKHPKIKTGKGCINLRDRDELPLDDLASVIDSAMTAAK